MHLTIYTLTIHTNYTHTVHLTIHAVRCRKGCRTWWRCSGWTVTTTIWVRSKASECTLLLLCLGVCIAAAVVDWCCAPVVDCCCVFSCPNLTFLNCHHNNLKSLHGIAPLQSLQVHALLSASAPPAALCTACTASDTSWLQFLDVSNNDLTLIGQAASCQLMCELNAYSNSIQSAETVMRPQWFSINHPWNWLLDAGAGVEALW